MNAQELKSKSIEASQFYYVYLKENNKGIEKINISSKNLINVENNTWELHIGKKLFSPDNIIIHNCQYDEDYGLADFTIKEYDADNKLLIIRFITQTHFGDTPANNLTIISDLKFLIKNVENWYTDNGQKISFNDETNNTQNGKTTTGQKGQGHNKQDDNLEHVIKCDLYPHDLNANQIQAFKNILNNRYNYIWGPPGTGKTQRVLSSAVLYYIKNRSPKIGIFAPTNNALEQVLSPIIEHFDKLGIPRENLLRIGAPSREYVEKYPETCEIQGLEKELTAIENQIENIKNVMEYRRRKYTFNSLFTIQKEIQNITDLNTRWEALLVSKSKKEKELEEIIKKRKSLTNQLKRIFNIKPIDYQILMSNKEIELVEIKNRIDPLNAEVNLCFLRIKNVDTHSQPIKEIIQNIDTRNISKVAEQLNHASKVIEDYLKRKEALSRSYSELNDEELNDLKIEHEKNYKKLESTKIEERIKNCPIIGMTLDGYIGRFSNVQINFSSIFVDEAGYVPLIKALTLFSNRCNITFLGDHKQLTPVCEFDNYNDILGFCRLLWSKPSIFSEMVLHKDEEYCLNIAETTDCPKFEYTKKSILTESHRFGANLCNLLDRLIYNIGYRSALDDDVELFYVEVENPIRDGRKNENECDKISNILSGCDNEDYCILTPYRDQVSLLQRNLQRARQEERILTIHKSQGREWNTVIFSVVDGGNIRPWFTDSTKPISQGLYVLNTAISRARKKLIIVCDAKYWLSKHDAERQLICCLIKISRKLSN